MDVRYNIERLKSTIDDLCNLVGLSMAILDTKRNFLYVNYAGSDSFCKCVQNNPEGRMLCACSDRAMIDKCAAERKPVSHICHAGLLDTVVPILKNKIICGYIVIGRVRPEKKPDGIYEKLDWLGCEKKELEEKYAEMPYISESRLDSLTRLISTIVFDKAIEIDYDDFISRITNYIDDNLAAPLTIDDLCLNLFVSKNYLYKSFRSFYSCTVNEYITARRVEKAKELLRDTGESVRRISEEVGFNNYTYFSRLFKNVTGISPNKYRKKDEK